MNMFNLRIDSSSISLIDNLVLDKCRKGNFKILPALNGLSDHVVQILMLENFQASTQNIVHKYEKRQIKPYPANVENMVSS